MRHRGLIERMDRQRGEWWLCRRDTDPRGKWTIKVARTPCVPLAYRLRTACVKLRWDWRFKVGFSYERAVRRLLVAQDEEKRTSKVALKTAERLKQIASTVDKISSKRT